MITPIHTQMLMGLLQAAAHVADRHTEIETSRHQLHTTAARLEHERGIFEARANIVGKLVDALVEKRVSAVKTGFTEVLQLYADQARHYMEQQRQISAAALEKHDPLERAEYKARLNEVDAELRRIRSDAKQIFRQMSEIVLLLDGGSLTLDQSFTQALLV